jgi:hypothetical protein
LANRDIRINELNLVYNVRFKSHLLYVTIHLTRLMSNVRVK